MRIHLLFLMAAWLVPGLAWADDPTFEFQAPPEEVPDEAVWKASAQAGMILTTGNSRTTTIAGGAKASRKAGNNKFEAEAEGAFARSTLFIANDTNSDGFISESEFAPVTQTSTRMWKLRGRYDRFLTEKNSLYATALLSADKPAGKEFAGGGQLGYSRTLLSGDVHSLVAEVGYDLSYESFVGPGDALTIHSARVFSGYEGKLSEDTGFSSSAEALFNLNSLDTPTGPADSFEDTRLNAKAGLTTKLFTDISFRFGFTAKYDHVPAPRPPFALPYIDGFQPAANKLDTITEATLIVQFL